MGQWGILLILGLARKGFLKHDLSPMTHMNSQRGELTSKQTYSGAVRRTKVQEMLSGVISPHPLSNF